MPSLELDLRLNRSFFQKRVFRSAGIQASQDAMRDDELLSINIPRQSDTSITALVAVNLRPAERRAFATLSAEPEVQMHPRKDDLIRRRCGIAADQDIHRVYSRPT